VKSLWIDTQAEWTSTRLNNDTTAQVLVTPTTIDEAVRKLGNDDASASLTVGAHVHLRNSRHRDHRNRGIVIAETAAS